MWQRPFEQSEYEARLSKVQAAMAEHGMGALILSDPSNMGWLTGYDAWSFYVHQAVIVPASGAPIWWGRKQDVAGAEITCWMESDRIRGYAEELVQSTTMHPMSDLGKVMASFSLATSKIGVETDNYYFSARAMQTLHATLPSASWAEATGLVNRCRAVKSPAEIALMRQAAAISERIVDCAAERIEPGVPKNQVVAEIYREAIIGTDAAWGDYPAIVPLLPSGAAAAAPHLTWDGAPFVAGEATTIEISGCVRRYHAPLCRTVFLGTPPDEMTRAAVALAEALEAAISAARAGNVAGDVATAVNGALAKAGIERDARCGYPIGLSYPPDWGERTASFRTGDETLLEPGMTFHLMPGLWMDGWGLAITESILIREDAPAECFCDRPRELIVKA